MVITCIHSLLLYVLCYGVRLSVRPLAISCEHNLSYSFQWMILKPFRIVTHGTLLCVKAVFYSSFTNRVMPFFKYLLMNNLVFIIGGLHFLWVYTAPVAGALVSMLNYIVMYSKNTNIAKMSLSTSLSLLLSLSLSLSFSLCFGHVST